MKPKPSIADDINAQRRALAAITDELRELAREVEAADAKAHTPAERDQVAMRQELNRLIKLHGDVADLPLIKHDGN